jgi:hypothetical protein
VVPQVPVSAATVLLDYNLVSVELQYTMQVVVVVVANPVVQPALVATGVAVQEPCC